MNSHKARPSAEGSDVRQMLCRTAVFFFLLSSVPFVFAQTSQPAITNSDIVSMAKAGIGDQIIILTIQRGPTKLDTSPQALIILKKAGLSDQVLDAVLAADKSSVGTQPAKPSKSTQSRRAQIPQSEQPIDPHDLFQRALNAIGPKESISSIQSTRSRYTYTVSASSGTPKSYDTTVTRVYPDKCATVFAPSSGPDITEVFTQEFGYTSSGGAKALLSDRDVTSHQRDFRMEPIAIAQHPQDYSAEFLGSEKTGRNYPRFIANYQFRSISYLGD